MRQEIERLHKILIPSEIKQLCFNYWFLKICDIFDVKLCKHESIEIEEEIVKTIQSNNECRNVFGCHQVSTGQFVWSILLKRVNGFCTLGVIYADKVSQYPEYADYAFDGDGICVQIHDGTLYDPAFNFPKVIKPLGKDVENVNMEIKIDLDEGSLYYAINGDKYKKAPYELKKDKSYRLAVTLPNEPMSEIQLI